MAEFGPYEEQYYQPCGECGTRLDIDMHIYIMTRRNVEITICTFCRQDMDWSGWVDDEME